MTTNERCMYSDSASFDDELSEIDRSKNKIPPNSVLGPSGFRMRKNVPAVEKKLHKAETFKIQDVPNTIAKSVRYCHLKRKLNRTQSTEKPILLCLKKCNENSCATYDSSKKLASKPQIIDPVIGDMITKINSLVRIKAEPMVETFKTRECLSQSEEHREDNPSGNILRRSSKRRKTNIQDSYNKMKFRAKSMTESYQKSLFTENKRRPQVSPILRSKYIPRYHGEIFRQNGRDDADKENLFVENEMLYNEKSSEMVRDSVEVSRTINSPVGIFFDNNVFESVAGSYKPTIALLAQPILPSSSSSAFCQIKDKCRNSKNAKVVKKASYLLQNYPNCETSFVSFVQMRSYLSSVFSLGSTMNEIKTLTNQSSVSLKTDSVADVIARLCFASSKLTECGHLKFRDFRLWFLKDFHKSANLQPSIKIITPNNLPLLPGAEQKIML